MTYDVVGSRWASHDNVVATADGTEVLIDPTAALLPDEIDSEDTLPHTVTLDEGDVLHVGQGGRMTGTRITANEGHPVGLFSLRA